MKKIIVILLILALAGCQSFKALPPFEKALVIGAGIAFAGVAGVMVYASTLPPITRETYDEIFGVGLTDLPRP